MSALDHYGPPDRFRFGIVTAIKPETARVRVYFPDLDLTTFWLPVLCRRTFRDKEFWLPDVDDQVACLLDKRGEDGVVLGAIFSKPDKPPTGATQDRRITQHEDGTIESYDRTTQHWSLAIPAGGRLSLSVGASSLEMTDDRITLTTPNIELNSK